MNKLGDIYVDGFFEKPLNLEEVLACIRSILNG
jgi:DNA-binding response OmpR family regulator